MEYPHILYKPEDTGIAWITINNPEKMNALTPDTYEGIIHYMDEADADPKVRAIVLTGAGRAFCAGSDQSRAIPTDAEEKQLGADYHRQRMMVGQKRTRAIRHVKKPTIGMINGPAVGAGFGIACYCDIRIGCEHAKFYLYRGQIPEQGDCWNLPKLIGIARALEFLYGGGPVEAEEAHRWGLLNKLVPHDKLEEETRAFCGRLIDTPPLQQWLGKMIMWRSFDMPLDATLEWCATAAPISIMSEDRVEARTAYREKRRPVFKGR